MKIRIDVVKSIFILSFICLFMAGALAVVNHFTYTKIKSDAAERAYGSRAKIIPEAEGFVPMDIEGKGLPESITDVHKAKNDTGYVFMVSVKGFGDENMKLLCGINMDGKIIESKSEDFVLSHAETSSYFIRVFTSQNLIRFWNKDKTDIENLSAVSGATVTSNALKRAFDYALTAFEIIRGDINE